jgi:hypothetical protein
MIALSHQILGIQKIGLIRMYVGVDIVLMGFHLCSIRNFKISSKIIY